MIILSETIENIDGIGQKKILVIQDGNDSVKAAISVSQDSQQYLQNNLTMLQKRFFELRTETHEKPIAAPDFLVASPTINPDPQAALAEAVAEGEKTEKSLGLIALSIAKGFSSDIDKQDLIDQYQAAITRLDGIIAGPLNTNAQVIAAVVDLAKIQKRTLKVLRKLVV